MLAAMERDGKTKDMAADVGSLLLDAGAGAKVRWAGVKVRVTEM